MRVTFIVLVCASVCLKVGVLAFSVTPCHEADAACHKVSAQNTLPQIAEGVTSLGMEPLDPLELRFVSADEAGLKLQFRDTVVKGLRHCKVLSLKRHGNKQVVELECSPTLIGNYVISGRLMILPIEGNGKYKIQIHNIIVKVTFDVGERESAGKKFWTLADWTHSVHFSKDGGVKFQFQNLFGGNKGLSDSVHEFANENWKDIFQEVAPPIVKAIVDRIIVEIRKFFDQIPIKELSLD